MLEVIATSVEDAIAAERAGADRLELCAALTEDGLTPSLGLVEAVLSVVNIPVHVIVRPHNLGFHYSAEDLAVMQGDIAHIKRVGAAGIVIGTLTEDLMIDEKALTQLLEEAEGMQVTFHRAFDAVVDQFTALQTLLTYPQITRVLTSGAAEKAVDAIPQLKQLLALVENKGPTILVGSGITAENMAYLLEETSAKEIHIGSGARRNRSFREPVDEQVIQYLKSMLGSR